MTDQDSPKSQLLELLKRESICALMLRWKLLEEEIENGLKTTTPKELLSSCIACIEDLVPRLVKFVNERPSASVRIEIKTHLTAALSWAKKCKDANAADTSGDATGQDAARLSLKMFPTPFDLNKKILHMLEKV